MTKKYWLVSDKKTGCKLRGSDGNVIKFDTFGDAFMYLSEKLKVDPQDFEIDPQY